MYRLLLYCVVVVVVVVAVAVAAVAAVVVVVVVVVAFYCSLFTTCYLRLATCGLRSRNSDKPDEVSWCDHVLRLQVTHCLLLLFLMVLLLL